MSTLQDIVDASEGEETKIDSLIAMQKTQKEALDAALKNTGIYPTPEQQAAIDKVFVTETEGAKKVQAALDANTPAVTGGTTGAPGEIPERTPEEVAHDNELSASGKPVLTDAEIWAGRGTAPLMARKGFQR